MDEGEDVGVAVGAPAPPLPPTRSRGAPSPPLTSALRAEVATCARLIHKNHSQHRRLFHWRAFRRAHAAARALLAVLERGAPPREVAGAGAAALRTLLACVAGPKSVTAVQVGAGHAGIVALCVAAVASLTDLAAKAARVEQ